MYSANSGSGTLQRLSLRMRTGWFGPTTVADVEQWIVTNTSAVFAPDAVEQIIAPTVNQILTTARGEVVSIGFLLSLWSGSSAMSSFVDAITRAHDQYERRNLVWQRCLAVLMYVVALCSGIVLLPIAAVGPGPLLAMPPVVESFDVRPGRSARVCRLCQGEV